MKWSCDTSWGGIHSDSGSGSGYYRFLPSRLGKEEELRGRAQVKSLDEELRGRAQVKSSGEEFR